MKNVKQMGALLLAALTAVSLTGCSLTTTDAGSSSETTTVISSVSDSSETGEQTVDSSTISTSYETVDYYMDTDSSAIAITLSGSSGECSGSGVSISDGKITITKGGTYVLTGSFEGQIYVDIDKDDDIALVLNGVTITSDDGPAIYIANANKAVIRTEEGTVNTVSDSTTYTDTEDQPWGAIFSKDDLSFNGNGTLIVNGNYNNGIVCKDELVFTSGTYEITAVNNAIKGVDSVGITDGTYILTSGGDAIKSNNEEDASLGYVDISGGTFTIVSETDGIQAISLIRISGGTFDITTGGGSANASTSSFWGSWGSISGEESASAKGLKANTIELYGGTFTINSSDDSIHSNGDLIYNGAVVTISSGDDGIHADGTLDISSGTIVIEKSYEGLEGAVINISGAAMSVTASDDAINVAGGSDSSSTNGRSGGNNFMMMDSNSSNILNITGGYIQLYAGGDGLDSNGYIYQSGGEVYVDGPTDGANGAIDYGIDYVMTGGSLVAAGSTGMAEAIGSSSTVYSVFVYTSGSAGDVITVVNEDGETVMEYTSSKSYGCVLLADESWEKGEVMTVYINGEEIAEVTLTITVNSVQTQNAGSSGAGGFNSFGGGMQPGGGRGGR